MASVRTVTPPPLMRRYQQEAALAILQAVERHEAEVLTVRMSRQSGKNELSSWIEEVLMVGCAGLVGVKGAPTQSPQADRSVRRLSARLRQRGHEQRVTSSDGYVTMGEASWWFGSGEPDANVVGGTAAELLEIDEAQDFDDEKYRKDYRPMAASTAAATVLYGTAWTEFDLLERTRRAALVAGAAAGRRYTFDVPWARVAEEVPAYGLFVEAEIRSCGHTPATPDPIFQTQFELTPVAGAGRLLNARQLELIQGDHPRQSEPLSASHNVYVGGLDIGGANLSGARSPDESVLTIGRSAFGGRGERGGGSLQIVAQYRWRGANHEAAWGEMDALIRLWRLAFVCIDATGIGEPAATHMIATHGERRIEALKYTAAVKSELAYDLMAAINTGRLKIWRPDGPGHGELLWQLTNCRAEYRPNQQIAWGVAPADGHDDLANSLALCERASRRGKPRRATQRSSS